MSALLLGVVVACATPTDAPGTAVAPGAHLVQSIDSDDAFVSEGDAVCADLLESVDETVAIDPGAGEPLLELARDASARLQQIDRPGVQRWDPRLGALVDRVFERAPVADEETAGRLFNLVGAARFAGLWTCGEEADADLGEAWTGAPTVEGHADRDDVAAAFERALTRFLDDHGSYHAQDPPSDADRRLGSGGPDDHGPGYVELERRLERDLRALPVPAGDEAALATLVHLYGRAGDAYAAGVSLGRGRGEARFEVGFLELWQFAGAGCVYGLELLCP